MAFYDNQGVLRDMFGNRIPLPPPPKSKAEKFFTKHKWGLRVLVFLLVVWWIGPMALIFWTIFLSAVLGHAVGSMVP